MHVSELLTDERPGREALDATLFGATNPLTLLPGDRRRGETTLAALQVTARSTLGAFALAYGGALVDHGFVRVLGSGCAKLPGDVLAWNGMPTPTLIGPLGDCFVIAVDVLGGLFALDGGRFRSGTHDVHYFAPDRLTWENLGMGHSSFLGFLCRGDLAQFYAGLRWPGWEAEVAALDGAKGITIYPPPFAERATPIAERQRATSPIERLVAVNQELARKLAAKSPKSGR